MVVTCLYCVVGNLFHNFVFEWELKNPQVPDKVFFWLILVIGLLGWLLLVVV